MQLPPSCGCCGSVTARDTWHVTTVPGMEGCPAQLLQAGHGEMMGTALEFMGWKSFSSSKNLPWSPQHSSCTGGPVQGLQSRIEKCLKGTSQPQIKQSLCSGLRVPLHSEGGKRVFRPVCPSAGRGCSGGCPVPWQVTGGLGPPSTGDSQISSLRSKKQPRLLLPCSKGPRSDVGGHLSLQGFRTMQ